MMNVHMPAIEKRVIPEMDRQLKKEPKAAHGARDARLAGRRDGRAARPALALQQVTADGLTRTHASAT